MGCRCPKPCGSRSTARSSRPRPITTSRTKRWGRRRASPFKDQSASRPFSAGGRRNASSRLVLSLRRIRLSVPPLHRHLHPERQRFQRLGQDPHPQRQGSLRAGGGQERERSRLPHHHRDGEHRTRRWVEEDLERRTALHFGQAGQPELPGSDLRVPGRYRGGRQQPDLVPLNRRGASPFPFFKIRVRPGCVVS